MVTYRRATAGDVTFLRDMLVVAADWRPEGPRRTVSEVMADPTLARYIDGWPRAGDIGVVAEAHAAVGAAWWRLFPPNERGYGFVDADTPEVSVGVRQDFRGQGVGQSLLETLIECAVREHVAGLSLSVEPDNYAVRLYKRLGFQVVSDAGGSLTMLLPLTPS